MSAINLSLPQELQTARVPSDNPKHSVGQLIRIAYSKLTVEFPVDHYILKTVGLLDHNDSCEQLVPLPVERRPPAPTETMKVREAGMRGARRAAGGSRSRFPGEECQHKQQRLHHHSPARARPLAGLSQTRNFS
ncbi:hypothetical protein ACJJTC_011235 [Scirpophaga incertulas]